MQVTVAFLPLSVGDFSGELTVHYNTGNTCSYLLEDVIDIVCIGESVYSSLHGSSVDVNVRLDRSSVTLGNTYIGLSTQRLAHIRTHTRRQPTLLKCHNIMFLLYKLIPCVSCDFLSGWGLPSFLPSRYICFLLVC